MRKYVIRKKELKIDLAPLIDVIFLLLIFFMVASSLNENSFMRATICLPKVGLTSDAEKFPIILQIDKDGHLFLDNKLISWEEMSGYLLEQNNLKLEKGIEIYADKDVYFKYIARVMEIAGKTNINKVNFILQSKKTF